MGTGGFRRVEESSSSYFVGVNIGKNEILELNEPKFEIFVSIVYFRVSLLDSSSFSGITSLKRTEVSN